MQRWAGVVARRPWAVLLVALLLAAASVAVTAARLEFRSSRSELISPELEWNARFQEWVGTFSGTQDMFVIVATHDSGGASARERAEALVLELGPVLAEAPHVESVVWGFEPASVSPKALRLLPREEFEDRLGDIAQAKPLLVSATPAELIANAIAQLRISAGDTVDVVEAADGIDDFTSLLRAFELRLTTPADQPVDIGGIVEPMEPWRFLETDNGRLLIVRVVPELRAGELVAVGAAIESVRGLLSELRQRYPDVEFGLTGAEVAEADETAAATWDSTWTSILAAIFIAALLLFTFRGWRMPVLILVTLSVAMAWAFGFLTLAVGHLQVISVVFTVMLLGLGVGFGIHLGWRYELARPRSASFEEALADVFATTGPGVITGAVTTAAAFATTIFTDFTGVAEMGFIAGAGILLCALAFFTVFPALLRIVIPAVAPRVSAWHAFEERAFLPFSRHAKATLIVGGIVTIASLAATSRMRFDYDLLALLPRGVESVEWQERIVEEGEQSVYFAVSLTRSLEEARERTARLRALPTVGDVMGIGLLFPPDEAAKLARLRDVRAELGDARTQEVRDGGADERLLPQLTAMRFALRLASGRAPEALRPPLASLVSQLDRVLAAARALPAEERRARLAALQRDYEGWRLTSVSQIRSALDDAPLTPGDLPAPLLSPYIADSGGETLYSLEIFPRPPERAEDALRPAFLRRFVGELRSVDPAVTGVVVQVYESGTLIWTSYVEAGVYALIVVFVLVWLDFRSVTDALLALAPVAVGFTVTFAVMWVVGEQVNPANIIVLPLMFGIGVDSGVHMIHRFRQHPDDRPRGLTRGTGTGVTVTALTTIIGFACLTLASHRGIASLGFTLALGIAMTLLACLVLMPAALEFRRHPSPH